MAARRNPREPRPITEESALMEQIRCARRDADAAQDVADALEALSVLDATASPIIPDEFWSDLQDAKERVSEELRDYDIAEDLRDLLGDEGIDYKIVRLVEKAARDFYVKKIDRSLEELSTNLDSAIENMNRDLQDHAIDYLIEGAESAISGASKNLSELERRFANTYLRRTTT